MSEEIKAELGYVRLQIARVAQQAPMDAPTEYDTVRFMWVNRAKVLEAELELFDQGAEA
jgi:hypothetical protein